MVNFKNYDTRKDRNEQRSKISKASRIFSGDTYAIYNKIEIVEANENFAICKGAIGENSLNGDGSIQGGLIYTLADFTFAVYTNYIAPVTVTQIGNISYVKPGRKENKYIYAKATLIEKLQEIFIVKFWYMMIKMKL